MKRSSVVFLMCLILAWLAIGPGAATRARAEAGSATVDPVPAHVSASAPANDRVYLNTAWTLVCTFLVFFMQAGFALVETGMTRAKNVAHTMAMNVMVYAVGALGFWAVGFALMYGGQGPSAEGSVPSPLGSECTLRLFGCDFGLFGYEGFFLGGQPLPMTVLALCLFQMMFMDTAATIPTGAMIERWKYSSFLLFGFFMSMVLFPVYGNWVWGHGWLSQLGRNFGLGHGHVDFAGSSVVHMVGGVTALIGTWFVGPRIGKFRPDGTPNPLPAHNVPMYMVGTLLLAFGWFGFNTGGVPAASDLNTARIALNTTLASAAGGCAAWFYMWYMYRKPDPSFLCNGLLAGLVSITAGCAYVAPWAAVLIGGFAGCLVIWSCLFVERVLRVDDPVGAVSVHGTVGAWGILALGLFADGTYGHDLNGVSGAVRGLFYGNATQLVAQCVGLVANILWVAPLAYGFFWAAGRLVGNRVSATVEMQGLDVPELGALGYITQDPKVPESRLIIQMPPEPRPAHVPPNGQKRFSVLIEGIDLGALTSTWSDLCQVHDQPPPPEFRVVYPFMTTMQGNCFRFRGGDPQAIRTNLERLFQERMKGRPVRARLE